MRVVVGLARVRRDDDHGVGVRQELYVSDDRSRVYIQLLQPYANSYGHTSLDNTCVKDWSRCAPV